MSNMDNMESTESMENNSGMAFEYSYSAKKQKEVEQLREKYLVYQNQDTPLAQMKQLDKQAEKNASKLPIQLGAAGTVLLGLGMCGTLAMEGMLWFVAGIVVGVLGIAGIAAAYPLYVKRVNEERSKIAPEILRLSKEAEN